MSASQMPQWQWYGDRFGFLRSGDSEGPWYIRADFRNSVVEVIALVTNDYWADWEKFKIREYLPGQNTFPVDQAVERTRALYEMAQGWVNGRLAAAAPESEPPQDRADG